MREIVKYLMMNNVKQHIVPTLYLSNFSINGRTFYYLVKKKKVLSGNIEDIAEENNYYSLDGLNNKFEWENVYSQELEPEFKYILERVIKCSKYKRTFPKKYHRALSQSLFYQFMRCGYARTYSKDVILEHEKQTLLPYIELLFMNSSVYKNTIYHNILFDKDDRPNSIDKIYDLIGDIAYKDIALAYHENKTLYKYFCKRKYVIYKITNDDNFITCDEPVLLMDINTYDSEKYKYGLKNVNTVIVFVINPKLLVISYHKENELYKNTGKIICLNKRDKDISFINNINKSIFKHARNFAISQDKKVLESIYSELVDMY